MNSPAQNRLLSLIQTPNQSLHTLFQILPQIITNPSNFNLLSNFITSCSSFPLTSALLRYLSPPHPSPWNLAIRAFAGHPQTLTFYPSMLSRKIQPDRATFIYLLRSLPGVLGGIVVGKFVHCHILKLGFAADSFVLTALLDFYAKSWCLGSTEKVFDEMPERDVVAHNVMIMAFGSQGQVEDARRVFDGMPEKSAASWNSMITSYCRQNDIISAREVFDRNPVKDVVSWNAIIDGYCKLGEMMMANELFDRMGMAKNSVTWNTIISGYLHHREFGMAAAMFRHMQAENVRPTEVTMVSLLSACSHMGALDMGRWIHSYIRNHNLKIDTVLGNALVDMYFKCGCVESALGVFHSMHVKNVYCWNSVIAGLGMHGFGQQAIEMFLEMERVVSVKPDGVTYVGLLSACSHSGLVCEGKRFFSQMQENYRIEPMIEHYGCMVDLLGRAGLLSEALNLIEIMPMKANPVVLGSLLKACRIHKDTRASKEVTQQLLELDPNDGANYVFLSNIYASKNQWDEVESCRRTMVDKGVHKIPGCSSVELDNMVHEFLSGDTSHPQFDQINAFLIEVDNESRKLGFRANTDSVLHDIEEEEKENAVKYHSEKIAIGFAFVNTKTSRQPIRIVKNLRVCDDCHEWTKYITKFLQREIIVRDRSRFHHFSNGICSCKDYW